MVIHATNPTTELEAKIVSKLFYKKIVRWDKWEEGEGKDATRVAVEPVDQELSATVREFFSRQVHGRSPSAVESYWQRQIFSGRKAPPKQLRSDQEVLDYVRTHREAIGYVSSGVTLGDGVKELRIQ